MNQNFTNWLRQENMRLKEELKHKEKEFKLQQNIIKLKDECLTEVQKKWDQQIHSMLEDHQQTLLALKAEAVLQLNQEHQVSLEIIESKDQRIKELTEALFEADIALKFAKPINFKIREIWPKTCKF